MNGKSTLFYTGCSRDTASRKTPDSGGSDLIHFHRNVKGFGCADSMAFRIYRALGVVEERPRSLCATTLTGKPNWYNEFPNRDTRAGCFEIESPMRFTEELNPSLFNKLEGDSCGNDLIASGALSLI